MGKVSVLSHVFTSDVDTLPSPSPGALNAIGIVDEPGSQLGIKSGVAYGSNAGGSSKFLIPGLNADGGEITVVMNPLSTGHPVQNFPGGLILGLNAGALANGYGFSLFLDNNFSTTTPVIQVSATRRLYHSANSLAVSNGLTVTLRVRPAGTGFRDIAYSITNNATATVIDSGRCLHDARLPNASAASPVAGSAFIGGFYPSFSSVQVFTFDGSGALAVADPPYVEWRSKSVLRCVGQQAHGGTGAYTYQWFSRQGTTGAFTAVATGGTSPILVASGLNAATTYQFYRTTNDGSTTLTSVTITGTTVANGALGLACFIIGDSNTEGPGPSSPSSFATGLAGAMIAGGVDFSYANYGAGGWSTDTQLGGSFLANLGVLVSELGVEIVSNTMGTNDVFEGAGTTGASYQASHDTIAKALATRGVKYVAHCPPYRSDANASQLTLLSTTYPAALNALAAANPTNTYVGATTLYAQSLTNFSTWTDAGNTVHFNTVGDNAIGSLEATVLRSILTAIYVSFDALTPEHTAISTEPAMVRTIRVRATNVGAAASGVAIVATSPTPSEIAIAPVTTGITNVNGYAAFTLTCPNAAAFPATVTLGFASGPITTSMIGTVVSFVGGSGGSPPAAPTAVLATSGNAQVTIAWTASPAATAYNIYQGTTPGGESALAVAGSPFAASPAILTGLTNGTPYYFTVKATNASGLSPASAEVPCTPVSAPSVSPAAASLSFGEVRQFTASGFPSTATWSCLKGTVTQAGLYTAPLVAGADTLMASYSVAGVSTGMVTINIPATITVVPTAAFKAVLSLGSTNTGLTLNGQLVDNAGVAIGPAIVAGYTEFGGGQYGLASPVVAGQSGYIKHYAAGAPAVVLAVSEVGLATLGALVPPVRCASLALNASVLAGNTAATVIGDALNSTTSVLLSGLSTAAALGYRGMQFEFGPTSANPSIRQAIDSAVPVGPYVRLGFLTPFGAIPAPGETGNVL